MEAVGERHRFPFPRGMVERLVSDAQSFGGSPRSVVGSRQESTRKVSSVVVSSERLGDAAAYGTDERITYVDVPVYHEVIVTVPRREVVEVEKRVPKVEIQYVDRVVEVPQIQYKDRIVEVEQIQEDVQYNYKKEVVEVPVEVIEHVPVIERRVVEQVVEVPGEIISVPKPYDVIHEVPKANLIVEESPVCVAQSLHPRFRLSTTKKHRVQVDHLRPRLIEVEVPIPKVIDDYPVYNLGVTEHWHRKVQVHDTQYNSLLKWLNPHINLADPAIQAQMPWRGDGAVFSDSAVHQNFRRYAILEKDKLRLDSNKAPDIVPHPYPSNITNLPNTFSPLPHQFHNQYVHSQMQSAGSGHVYNPGMQGTAASNVAMYGGHVTGDRSGPVFSPAFSPTHSQAYATQAYATQGFASQAFGAQGYAPMTPASTSHRGARGGTSFYASNYAAEFPGFMAQASPVTGRVHPTLMPPRHSHSVVSARAHPTVVAPSNPRRG